MGQCVEYFGAPGTPGVLVVLHNAGKQHGIESVHAAPGPGVPQLAPTHSFKQAGEVSRLNVAMPQIPELMGKRRTLISPSADPTS